MSAQYARLCRSSLLVLLQVEKAPTVVKAGLKKEEAEELKKKLEAGANSATGSLLRY